jgi:hypothetical protein
MDYWTKVRQRVNSLIGNYHDVEFVINSYQLTPEQIAAFKRLTGSMILEPGRYWLDPTTGNMGPEGNPSPSMNIFQHLMSQTMAGSSPQPSLSERRQLFNSADLTGIWGAY